MVSLYANCGLPEYIMVLLHVSSMEIEKLPEQKLSLFKYQKSYNLDCEAFDLVCYMI